MFLGIDRLQIELPQPTKADGLASRRYASSISRLTRRRHLSLRRFATSTAFGTRGTRPPCNVGARGDPYPFLRAGSGQNSYQ
jgi:hypothetical protein